MVLEHVDGTALSRLRSLLKAIGREVDDRAAVAIAARVYSALAAAHNAIDDSGMPAPVIHRDVNPSNILVSWSGDVKLADFGVAKVTGATHESVAGMMMMKGTYGYMAPEQVTGTFVSSRADVYAAAIILWELLTKRRAFQRGALPESEAIRAMAEPRLLSLDAVRPDVHRSIREAVKRALAPNPERRNVSAEEMSAVLSAIVPPEEGRERLIALLALVKNDGRVSLPPSRPPRGESLPPFTVAAPRTVHAAIAPPAPSIVAPPAPPSSGRGLRPALRPSSKSLPVARATGPYNELPRPEPPPMPKAPASVAKTAVGLPLAPAVSRASMRPEFGRRPEPKPRDESSEPRRPSAAQRLAGAVPDAKRELLLETDTVPASQAERAEARAATPLAVETASRSFDDAVDEILQSQPGAPSPPGPKDTVMVAPANVDRQESTRVMAAAPVRSIGAIPAAPAPMAPMPTRPVSSASLPKLAVGDTPRPHVMTKTLAMEARPDARTAPPPPPLPPQASSTRSMLAFRAPPPESEHPSRPAPDARASGPDSVSPPASGPPARVGESRAAPPVSERPPARESGRTLALLATVLVGIAGLAGAAWVRHKRLVTTRPVASAVLSASALVPPVTASSADVSPPPDAASTLASGATTTAPDAGPASIADAEEGASWRLADGGGGGSSRLVDAAVAMATGIVRTAAAVPYRRIFVDEKTLGQTPASVAVPCGVHTIRLGSTGKPQSIDVPCGGEITVGDR